MKAQKEKELGKVNSIVVSANHKKMFLNLKGKYAVIDLPKTKVKPDELLDLSNMKVKVSFEEEWNQIFNDTWRRIEIRHTVWHNYPKPSC